jgi:hypothetical protein
MEKEILQEIRDLKELIIKITGLETEKTENQFSEGALNNAQKLYLKMSIERGDWVKESEIGRYIESLPWNPGAFIRKEFEFTSWIKRGHEWLYAKKDLIALGEELANRKIDCKRYKEFLDDKVAFDKRMTVLEEAKMKKIPPWKIQKGLKNITTTEIPKPDPEKVRGHLAELKQEYKTNKYALYIDIYKGTHAQMKNMYNYEKYLEPGIKRGCRKWIDDFNYANHALELITGKKEKFKVENNAEGIQL